ncbi:hypothetical protein [Bradyrhizobium sp. USDA 10063]
MADSYVPDDIRDFILKHIDSVAQIEALLLIQSHPQERWTIPQIAARLYMGDSDTKEALDRLRTTGLLDCEKEVYRLEGVSAGNMLLIERLLAVYTRHLIPVTNIIHAKPRRIRSFADAFKLRKDP